MRNLFLQTVVPICLFFLPVMAVHAQGVAVVDTQYLIANAPQAESLDQQLQDAFGPAQQEMQAKQQEYRDLAEELQRDELVMGEEERAEKEERLAGLEQEIRQMQQQLQQQFGQRRQQALGQLQQLIAEEAQAVAESEGYDVVVGQGVLYATDSVDLTDRVLERLEQRAEQEESSEDGE